jgi:hypothetical protein
VPHRLLQPSSFKVEDIAVQEVLDALISLEAELNGERMP